MNKRERLEKTLAGEAVDRVPVALWRHWPGDDQRSADLARAVVDFQRTYDWDFVKVTPFSAYCVADYGVQTQWQGDVSGDRVVIKRPVRRSLDWTELRTLDPVRGELGKHMAAIELICQGVDAGEVPVLATIYSPLTQAVMIAGEEFTLRHMRTEPDRLRTGLNIITETTMRLIDALKRTGVAGMFYEMGHASFSLMCEEEYAAFAAPYDRKILETLPPKWWLNFIHVPGSAPLFELAAGMPVQVIHWQMDEGRPDFDQARLLFPGALSGGLSQSEHLHLGAPSVVRDVGRDLLTRSEGRRLILTAGGAVPVSVPLSNLRAAREVVNNIVEVT
jgi:uroporphyrinogen decarboxylase